MYDSLISRGSIEVWKEHSIVAGHLTEIISIVVQRWPTHPKYVHLPCGSACQGKRIVLHHHGLPVTCMMEWKRIHLSPLGRAEQHHLSGTRIQFTSCSRRLVVYLLPSLKLAEEVVLLVVVCGSHMARRSNQQKICRQITKPQLHKPSEESLLAVFIAVPALSTRTQCPSQHA